MNLCVANRIIVRDVDPYQTANIIESNDRSLANPIPFKIKDYVSK